MTHNLMRMITMVEKGLQGQMVVHIRILPTFNLILQTSQMMTMRLLTAVDLSIKTVPVYFGKQEKELVEYKF